MNSMQLSKSFPELSEGQLKMLERYVQAREQNAVTAYAEERDDNGV